MRVFHIPYLLFYLDKIISYREDQKPHIEVVENFLNSRPDIKEIVGVCIPEFSHLGQMSHRSSKFRMYKINRDITWFLHEEPSERLLMLLKTKKEDFNAFLYSLEKIKPFETKDFTISDASFWGNHYQNFHHLHITKILRRRDFTGPSFLKDDTPNPQGGNHV